MAFVGNTGLLLRKEASWSIGSGWERFLLSFIDILSGIKHSHFLCALELGSNYVILAGLEFTETHLPLPPSHTITPLNRTFFFFLTVWRLI